MDIPQILENAFIKLTIISLLLILFTILTDLHLLRIEIFILILPLLGIPFIRNTYTEREKRKIDTRIIWIVLASVFILSFFIRYYPYFWTNVPPGYDPGLYKYGLDTYISSLPHVPEDTLPGWFKEMFPQGIFLLGDMLYMVAGFSSTEIIKIFTPLVCGLMVLPVFAVSRHISSQRGALISVVIYLLSATQYVLFEYSYLKNILGLFLILVAILLLQKEKYITLAIIYAVLSIYHRPHFLLLSLVLLFWLLETKDTKIYLTFIIAAVLMLPFWLPRMELGISMLKGLFSVALSNFSGDIKTQGGTFLTFSKYGYLSLPYITFGILGFMHLLLNKRRGPVFYFTLITAIMVILRIVFFRRYLATLDILLIILAGGCIEKILFEQRKELLISIKIILLLIGLTGSMLLYGEMTEDNRLISDSHLQDIEWMAENIDPESYILTSSDDAPWVLGWGEHPVVAPGLFHWDIYPQEEWAEFLSTSDPQHSIKFFSKYKETIYIYYSMDITDIELDKYSAKEFQLIRENKGKIYRYTGSVQ
jgi:hypothetical protein